jgi:hypothetical protein
MVNQNCCKVGRVTNRYDLASPRQFTGDLDDYIVAKWNGFGQRDSIGIRPLTEWFNKLLLRTIYRTHGRSDSDTRIDAEFETLSGTDIPAHKQAETRSELESDGIDAEELVQRFISKSTLSRHVTDCLGAEKDAATEATTNWEMNQLRIANQKHEEKVSSAVMSLGNKGRISGFDSVIIETAVYLACPECSTRIKLETALKRGYVCAEHLGRDSERKDKQISIPGNVFSTD